MWVALFVGIWGFLTVEYEVICGGVGDRVVVVRKWVIVL